MGKFEGVVHNELNCYVRWTTAVIADIFAVQKQVELGRAFHTSSVLDFLSKFIMEMITAR